jgi:hypothetical protein
MGRIAPPIQLSVGRDAVNAPIDVYVVQSLLNARLPQPHDTVVANGQADIGLTLAIETYQAVVMKMLPPTGRVEPGSETFYSLACRPLVNDTGAGGFGHFGKTPPQVIDAAVQSHRTWKVPASVTIAQWAVESAWGAAMPPGSNNPFGIKAVGDQPAVESQTHEVVGGATVTITARFRKFESLSEAFDQHGRLLATGARYRPAMAVAGDPAAFADALTGVYATDPNYGTILKYAIRTYGLAQYDQE